LRKNACYFAIRKASAALNGDELKLRYNVESYGDGEQNHVYVVSLRVTGDQVAAYPDFVREAEAILQFKQREETSRSKAA